MTLVLTESLPNQCARVYRRLSTDQLLTLLDQNIYHPIQTIVSDVRIEAAKAVLCRRFSACLATDSTVSSFCLS